MTTPKKPGDTAPTLADLDALANRALETVPAELRRHLGAVVIRVEDFPDEDTEKEMGLESPFDLLGLIAVWACRARASATRARIST